MSIKTIEPIATSLNTKPVHILLVEDNPGDVILIEEALKEGKLIVNLTAVENGVEALQYLRNEGAYQDEPKPDVIILDLNLPRKNGLEVLQEIKNSENLGQIPVVVLTTSNVGGDIIKTYKMGATCFITKPFGFYNFMEAVKSIEQFWFNLVTLPPR